MATKSPQDIDVFASLREGIGNALTLKTYVSRLLQTARDTGACPPASPRATTRGEEPSERERACVLHLLCHPAKFAPVMERLYGARSATTHKNMLTAVLAAFKHDAALRCAQPAALQRWREEHARLCELEDARYDLNQPLNDRQVQRYVSFDEVEAKLAALLAPAGAGPSSDPHATLRGSLEVVLLALVAHLPPKRADYGAVRVFRSARAAEAATGPDDNFAVVVAAQAAASGSGAQRQAARSGSYLVLRRFKTAARHQEIVDAIPAPLAAVLRASLEAHPREWLLVDGRGRPYSNNAYSKFFARTFERHFGGRKAGPSLMRHAYVSERIDFDAVSRADRKEIARSMGHTIEVQERMYKWVGPKPGASASTTTVTRRPPAAPPSSRAINASTPPQPPRCTCTCRCSPAAGARG
jgi:hypothetical protein